MLQIVSGRFFGDGEIKTENFDAVLYSNFSWILPIVTADGVLRPANTRGRISSLVLRYTIRYERRPNDTLVCPNGNQIVEQLSLLAGLWFQAIFHPDRNHVELLCRPETRHESDHGAPSQFIDKFFGAPLRGDMQQIEGFQSFVEKVIAMPRVTFRLFMSCLRVFFNAMEAIDTNKDLAYSMFVYVLEGLTQGSDGFVPTWEDFPDDSRKKIDSALSGLPEENAKEIRDVLSSSPHLKLMKRFIEFTINHVDDDFFGLEAHQRTPALPRNELQQALKNLYQSRSGFVHALEQVQEHIKIPFGNPSADYFRWDAQPHLTFSGLARICRHVLLNFVHRQPVLEKEVYPEWRNELPGIIMFEAAPQYWIWKSEAFTSESIKPRYSGFIQHTIEVIANQQAKFTDMRAVIDVIANKLPQAKKEYRGVMVCTYWLWHQFFPRENWFERIREYKNHIEICSIQMMAARVVLNTRFEWQLDDCEKEFENYLKNRFRSTEIRLPSIVEVAIASEMANIGLRSGDALKFTIWIDRAILDAAGNKYVQEYLQRCKIGNEEIDKYTVLGVQNQRIPEEEWLNWL